MKNEGAAVDKGKYGASVQAGGCLRVRCKDLFARGMRVTEARS